MDRQYTASPLSDAVINEYDGSQSTPSGSSLSSGSDGEGFPEEDLPRERAKKNSLELHEDQKRVLKKEDLLAQIREKGAASLQRQEIQSKKRPQPKPRESEPEEPPEGGLILVSGSVTGSFLVQTSMFVKFIHSEVLIDDYTSANRKATDRPEDSCVFESSSEECNRVEEESNWMTDLVSYLKEWLHFSLLAEEEVAKETPHIDFSPNSPFWQEWEWVISRSEELAMEHGKQQSLEIRQEIASLKKRANLFKQRPFFRQSTMSFFEKIDPETRRWLGFGLDTSKRNKIIRDTIQELKTEWIANFGKLVHEEVEESKEGGETLLNSFESLFEEKPYEKNLEGAIVSMALFASHGTTKGGLTSVILSEILWNIWSVLWKNIQKFVEDEGLRELGPEAAEIVAQETLKAQTILVRLWAQTAKNAQGGSEREGKLVEKWAEEERLAEEKRLLENVPPDFRYSPFAPEPMPMRKSTLTAKRLTILRSKLDDLFGSATPSTK